MSEKYFKSTTNRAVIYNKVKTADTKSRAADESRCVVKINAVLLRRNFK